MTLGRRSFDLLCLSVLVTLGLHAAHMPPWISVPLALLLGARWAQRRWYGTRVPVWFKLALVIALPVAIIAAYGSPFGRAPGSALAVGLLVLKLLESERTRDARAGVAFVCFVLMSALLFDQGLVATICVSLGLVPALASLRLLESDAEQVHVLPALGLSGMLLAISLPLALAGFVFVPRLSAPLWGAPAQDQARSGVSGHMAPGDFTELLIDDSPAFRVHFEGPPPAPQQRYFRGPVLWKFDGRAWTRGDWRRGPIEDFAASGRRYDYEVSLEPTHRRWLFALDVPLAAPEQGRLGPARTAWRGKPVDSRLSYRMSSSAQGIEDSALDALSRRMALQLPSGFDPRSRALAQRWRKLYGGNDRAIVKMALGMFNRQAFRYTLVPAPLGRDSVDDFLFDTREGFCEHYASAFTFLMRAAGIPARVVTGYQGGFFNKLADYLLVRQSDAHAWSEVWLPRQGWTRVDPTAAVSPERVDLGAGAATPDGEQAWYQSAWLRGMRNRWDVINRLWNSAVVGFDALRQQGLLTPFGVRSTDWGALAVGLSLSSSLLLAIGLALTLWRRRSGDPLSRSQTRLQRRLARAGVKRARGEGPRDFFTRAIRALPHHRRQLRRLAAYYLKLRYGDTKPNAPESVHNYARMVRNFRPRKASKLR